MVKSLLTWMALVAFLVILLPGFVAGFLTRWKLWPENRTVMVARWLAAALAVAWWAFAVFILHIANPYAWLGVAVSTPVRVLAFLAWCLCPYYLAPVVAERVMKFNRPAKQ